MRQFSPRPYFTLMFRDADGIQHTRTSTSTVYRDDEEYQAHLIAAAESAELLTDSCALPSHCPPINLPKMLLPLQSTSSPLRDM